MGKGRTTLDITQRVNPRYVRFQALIHMDETTFIGLHTGGREIEPIAIWRSTSRYEQVGTCQRSFAFGSSHR